MVEAVLTYEPNETGWSSLTVSDAPKQTLKNWVRTSGSTAISQAVDGFKNWYDAAVLPGQAVTPSTVAAYRARRRLRQLVDRLCADLSVLGVEGRPQHAEMTRAASRCFLNALPLSAPLPKVSPDGEGGLIFLWLDAPKLLVGVDDWTLHYVQAAGTPQAVYRDDVAFAENSLPDELLLAIAAR